VSWAAIHCRFRDQQPAAVTTRADPCFLQIGTMQIGDTLGRHTTIDPRSSADWQCACRMPRPSPHCTLR